MAKILRKASFFLIVTLSSILIAELLVRVAMPLEKRRNRYMATRNIFQHDRKNTRFDEELGFMAKPNLNVRFDNEEFRTTVMTNSAGFRDDEPSLTGADIFILGDSFGFGWGVNRNDSLDKLLEDACEKAVLNMSVSGYGTLQEYELLRRWSKGHDIKGKTAIFLFYPNDVIESLETPKEEELRNLFDMYDKASCRGIYKASRLAYMVKKALRKIKDIIKRKRDAGGRPAEKGYEADPSLRFRVFRSVIGRLKEFAAQERLNVVFVWIPSVKYFEKNDALYDGDSEEYVFSKVKEALDEASFPLIDLRKSLARNDYYIYDGHWKPSGHYKAAFAIKRYLAENRI